MGQFRSLGRRLQKDDTLRKRYRVTNFTHIKAGYVRKVGQNEWIDTRDKLQWYLPHNLLINPHKPKKIRQLCNAAAKYRLAALNHKPVSGPDLLQNLRWVIFRFRELRRALSADIQPMFLQVAVPSDDSRRLKFLWREDPEQRLEVYEYTRHVYWAMSSPIWTNYALHQVIKKDNAKDDKNLVKIVQPKFLQGQLSEVSQNNSLSNWNVQTFREFVSKGRFNLLKWITSDESVKSQIPEADRSSEVVETFET